MRRKISLYIAGQPVDLDEQSFILYNYTMEEMSNPTIVRNSFSQQITLKGTANNNKIFGDIFRLDRITQYGDAYSGAYFDASRKTPFVIYNEMNEILENGYVKLDQVSRISGLTEYKVTLYGGLGSFFYALSIGDDGVKKSLASLRYRTMDGGYTRYPGHFGQAGGYSMLQDAWAYLNDPDGYNLEVQDNWWPDIINFAPCYNGIPDDFSADKAVVDNKSFDNVPYTKVIDNTTYTFKTGTNANLMLFSNPHTEWEIKDLRWYLQRPVIRIKAIFDAICDPENNGGYEVELSSTFFNESNNLYWNGWMTLPLIPAEDRKQDDAVVRLLSATQSPADYMISFAKMFGLVFLYDVSTRKVQVMPRREFYQNTGLTDMTDRISRESITISPVLAQSKYYQFGGGAVGEWASRYKVDFGRDYAIQIVNTGNEFNSEISKITEGIAFKDAVDVQERNLLFTSNALVGGGSAIIEENFILPMYEQVKVQLWGLKTGDSEQSMQEVDILCEQDLNRFFINPDFPLSDWLPKVQFHQEDNKPIDGSDVLVVFNGMQTTPSWTSWASLEYRLTDDIPDMMSLNDNTPCWNFSQSNSVKRKTLPSFRRCHTYDVDGDDVINESFEWGLPKARGVNGVYDESTNPATIYNRWWQAYLSDRYDDDTFKMTCKVDLRGLKVGQGMLRQFYYYDGAVFALNRIINHSLTTWDDTECEFVKVQDINNYIG